MRVHEITARGLLVAAIVATLAGVARPQDEDGFYVGGFLPYTTMWGDFDGKHFLVDPDQSLVLPDIHDGTGWGAIVGFRRGWFAGELTYQHSRHDWTMQTDATPLPMRGSATIDSLAINAKAFAPIDGPIQPFVVVGPSLTFVDLDDGSADLLDNIGDAEFSGFGANAGFGVAIYIGDKVCLSATVQYHMNLFDSYRGKGGSGHLPGGEEDEEHHHHHNDQRLWGDGFTYLASLTYTF